MPLLMRNFTPPRIAATERLVEVLGERQRRELVHNDLDRTWQASRRINLSNLVHQVEFATEGGKAPIVTGASTLQLKAEDMLAALEAVRATFDETACVAESSRAMNHAAGHVVRSGDAGDCRNFQTGAAR